MDERDAECSMETDKMLTENERDLVWRQNSRSKTLLHFILIALSAVVILETVLLLIGDVRDFKSIALGNLRSCRNPAIRREWRSLRREEKMAYLEAVHCLFQKASVLDDRGSLYDDFVWVHQWAGQTVHRHPSFLPWHRWFIHQFERTLQDACGYKGHLPYWDWTVDWQSLADSSIWNNEDGFGGRSGGDTGAPGQREYEHCVSGPFRDVVVLNYNFTIRQHCLSRQFQSGERGTLSRELIRPEAMGQLARSPYYGSLRYMIEMQMHNIIHFGVKGDLGTVSSANDPIFWLHHAQLDRLWWKWQQDDPQNRLMDYGDSPEQPSSSGIGDEMQYLGLFEAQTISRVMRTDTDLLCYGY